ncbi:MAG: Hsp20/alpha crystallin family protein [Thermoanaerobaculia bacterium]|nr:Hsp20/alpha crystallin family protein [Thermoanaerobaculia bacterium]
MTGLIRWTPQADLFRTRVGRLFDDAFNDFLSPVGDAEISTRSWMPPVDIRETENELVLTAELPGMTKDDIEITLENNVLTLSGQRNFEKDVERESYHRIERAYGRFSRSFALPRNFSTEDVKAQFKDGVLHITLPKREEAKPRRIDIR